jgi:L-threonylcarbamoyladenylate synthase
VAAIDDAVSAIRGGRAVILPTDTVYGLCASVERESAVGRLYELKRRPRSEPMAIVAPNLERLFEAVPELRGRADAVASTLLPGPFTLVLPNPARRYPWVNGDGPESIGVRVPVLGDDVRAVLERAGLVAATSANHRRGPDPHALQDVPPELRAGCAAAIDGGELPGVASTVLDLTGPEPRVLREGAVAAGEALDRARAAIA